MRIESSLPSRDGFCLRDEGFPENNNGEMTSSALNKGTAILFHGMTGTPLEMGPLAELLHQEGYSVVVPLLAGHGSSISELKVVPASRWLDDSLMVYEWTKANCAPPFFAAGLSFGSLLALYLATLAVTEFSAVSLLSPPLQLKPRWREIMLSLLSYLPDSILNSLGVVEKSKRPDNCLALKHDSFSSHSLAAGARLIQVRGGLLQKLSKVRTPILLVQDPYDHHLTTRGPTILAEHYKGQLRVEWIEGGEHELTIGHHRERVIKLVIEFFNQHQPNEKERSYAP